jgi:hypothetical protein
MRLVARPVLPGRAASCCACTGDTHCVYHLCLCYSPFCLLMGLALSLPWGTGGAEQLTGQILERPLGRTTECHGGGSLVHYHLLQL